MNSGQVRVRGVVAQSRGAINIGRYSVRLSLFEVRSALGAWPDRRRDDDLDPNA